MKQIHSRQGDGIKLTWLVGCVLLLYAAPSFAADKPKPPNPQAIEFFETEIRPMLFEKCFACHADKLQQSGLRLDSREAMMKGGNRGAAIAPNEPEKSLLLQAVRHDADLKMPPTGKLTDEQIAALTAWIKMGAPWTENPKSQIPNPKLHWAFQPIRKPAVPSIRNPQSAIRNPIDAFVLAQLEKKGMTPAPPAGKRELMRRAYFDLIGLPPTPEEVDTFLADTSPNAYEKLVDRLLASPRYGERWARYWLDLVRYADSNGYERDAEKKYAWKYRDYVIESFNNDKPFDRFVTEQLAGDELPNRTEETVIATGFLRLGTWDDEPNDPLQYKYERLDDLVHATGAAFLGLTVKCARCHDHKFDPIPQTDYYAFASAFYGGFLDGGTMGGPPEDKLGFPVLGFTDKGRDAPPLRLLKSGDPRNELAEVPPGYLTLISQIKRVVEPPSPDAKTTRRRLQLAAWIVDPQNPLTARVLVNRLWQHHFGRGIVSTPNNFGSKGALPTHPELLDWLAATFMDDGQWSMVNGQWRHQPSSIDHQPLTIKKMHRLIMLSNTYRMASVHPKQTAYERKDFLNKFLWRANRRRLDADALRDAMLSVSGQLNLKMSGPGFFPILTPEALEGLSRKGAAWTPSPPDEQRRRSIYMFLKRSLLPPMMTVFDFSDTTQPLEGRDVTIVPPQALALMNNPFAHEQSAAFAQRVIAEVGADAAQQIERAWRLAFGRSPTATERAAALAHLQRQSLASLCHVLMNTNEFIYVD